MKPETDPSYALGHWFGLSATPARLLAEMYARGPGNWLSIDEVASPMRRQTVGAMRHAVCMIRQALDAESLDCLHGSGSYCLTEEGMAECRVALRKLGAELLEVA